MPACNDHHSGVPVKDNRVVDMIEAARDGPDCRRHHPFGGKKLWTIIDKRDVQAKHRSQSGDALADVSGTNDDQGAAAADPFNYISSPIRRRFDYRERRPAIPNFADFVADCFGQADAAEVFPIVDPGARRRRMSVGQGGECPD
jgi:hypothetical protein